MKKMLVIASMVVMLNTNVYADIDNVTITTDSTSVVRAGYMPTVEVADTMDLNKNGSNTDVLNMNVLEQNNRTAKFSIVEYANGAIDVEKPITITVPKGVTITGIKIDDSKVLYDGKGYAQVREAYGFNENEFEVESSAFFDRVVQFDGNSVTLKNGEVIDSGKLIDMRVNLYVTAPYDYIGDIDVTVSGEGVGGTTNSISVGEITQVVDIDTNMSTVSKGENLTDDIVISEVVGGSFRMGEVINIKLSNGGKFIETPKVTVKGGNLKGVAKLSSDRTSVKLTLDGKSTSNDKGIITLSNIKVDTTNVAVDDVVDITINSDYAISNPVNLAYVFVEKGDETEVEVVENNNEETEVVEDNTNNQTAGKFNENVVFTVGQKYVSIGGKVKDISYAPYVSKKSGSTMIPLRALAEALGIPSEHVLWYQPTQTATIIVDDTTVAQFSIGSNVCYINANSVPMTSASGVVDITEYQDGAVFLPMRFLSEVVFKVPVSWDKARPKEVVFN